jgi:hypothetical protein
MQWIAHGHRPNRASEALAGGLMPRASAMTCVLLGSDPSRGLPKPMEAHGAHVAPAFSRPHIPFGAARHAARGRPPNYEGASIRSALSLSPPNENGAFLPRSCLLDVSARNP